MAIFWKFHGVCVMLGQLLSTSLLLVACQAPTYTDAVNVVTAQRLNVPEAEYRDVAWLDKDTQAFVYRLPEFGDRSGDFRIATYNANDHSWQDIPIPLKPEQCAHAPAIVKHVSRLPNSNLGYIYPCLGDHGISGILYEWDRSTNIVQQVHHYPPPFRANSYTFSPDMSQLIQETGAGFSNALYRVNQSSELTQIFSDYQRVAEPSWSPTGKMIAFIGTEIYPKQTNDPKTWGQIEDLFLYPWDLYLMDANGNNVRILVPQAGRLYQLEWSPDGNFLAFSRDTQHIEGIWILNIDSLELVRVWPDNTFYDWSPDGTKMIIIAEDEEGNVAKTYPVIIDVPLLAQ